MPSSPLANLLTNLPERHRAALQWYETHAGEVLPWPKPLEQNTLLATKAKGIYKPEWSEYALSVRHSMTGPYPDGPIEPQPDGLWSFDYHVEGFDPSDARALFTNMGLVNCWRDVVPVGVLYQVKKKPDPRYKVIGLALIDDLTDSHFRFQGVSPLVADPSEHHASNLESPQQRANDIAGYFDPRRIAEARKKTEALIVRRQGQGLFRKLMLDAYERRCPISDYDAIDALEAAHIIPYRGPVTNHPSNGLILRADLHNLFDLGLIGFKAESSNRLQVVIDDELEGTKYEYLAERALRVPKDPNLRPSLDALRMHFEQSGLDR